MAGKIIKAIGISILLIIVWDMVCSEAYGSDVKGEESYSDEDIEADLEEYDFYNVEKALEGEDINFTDMVKKLATGQSEGVFSQMFKSVMSKLFGDISYNKEAVVKIIFIAIISALFSNMSIVLKKSDMSETGFYVTYMLMITILMGGFVVMADMVSETIKSIIIFMDALIPAFFLSVRMASGSVSAVGFSQIILIAINIIDKFLISFVLPLVNVYVIILLVNNIVMEDYFSKFADVLKTFISWMLKGFITILLGANIIQGMILPSVDGAKTGIVNKIINIIPGGSAITSVEGIVTTTSAVIKNAIGGAGLIAIVVICVFPMAKMLIYTAMYKITGAVIQPISDKRIGNSLDAVSEGIGMLYKIILTVAVLFFITIAIVCFTTNIKI